jgi:hypothetical protein
MLVFAFDGGYLTMQVYIVLGVPAKKTRTRNAVKKSLGEQTSSSCFTA